MHQLQLRLHHEPRQNHSAINAEYSQQAKAKPPKRPLHLSYTAAPGVDTSAPDCIDLSRFKRRCGSCLPFNAFLRNCMCLSSLLQMLPHV